MLNGIIPSSWSPHLLAALRIMTALLFAQHGLSKFTGFPPVPAMGGVMPITSFFGALGVVETIGAILIALGLFTRITAFFLSGLMAAAYFIAHAPQNFFPINNGGESAILFCFIFLYIAAAGPGSFSLDHSRK